MVTMCKNQPNYNGQLGRGNCAYLNTTETKTKFHKIKTENKTN